MHVCYWRRRLEDALDARTAELIALRKAAVEHTAASPIKSAPLQSALGAWASGPSPLGCVPHPFLHFMRDSAPMPAFDLSLACIAPLPLRFVGKFAETLALAFPLAFIPPFAPVNFMTYTSACACPSSGTNTCRALIPSGLLRTRGSCYANMH